ncbi:MAG: hypothetical protein H7099_05650 [Gemmatimonadaceae bacterium]|nr:hypothetical protein [Gemmatimonadaceae bacterium]
MRVMLMLGVYTSLCAPIAHAQSRPATRGDTLSTRVRDSLIAAVLADTLDADVDTLALLPLLPSMRQSFTIRPTLRTYSIGNVNASEQASYASWVARFRRATLRVDLTPVSYSGDTNTTTAEHPQVGFSGVSPISGRLDLALRGADTLRVFAQSMSFPGALTTTDALALGAVGTSTVDLDAGALGIAARTGVRYTLTQRLGAHGIALTVRGGVEYDPKPTGTESVSWRGTTVRGAVGLSRVLVSGAVGASIEMTKSYSDSLGGRNLFPGGGALNVDARALRFFGSDGDGSFSLNGFYSRPLNIERPDQPTRLIPVGDFYGVTGAASIPAGRLSVLPVVSLLRETSNASAIVSGRNTTLDARGQTASISVGLSIPLGSLVTVTPEVGGVFGNVGQTVAAQFPRRVRSRSFDDSIRGGWVSLEISVSP